MRYLLAAAALLLAASASAEPFNECPSKAFLTQGKVPSTYSINLVTGNYQVLAQSMGVSKPVNGVGFNSNDKYVYGWSYEDKKPARIHNDFSVEALDVDNIAGTDFYVGDVSTVDNSYYVYKPGDDYGLYAIALDPASTDYLTMRRIIDGTSLSLRIADMAFHPFTNTAYAVDSRGDLYEIDVLNGTANLLSNIGETGTYGAVYFDPDGYFYASRNQDGSIFRINIDSGTYESVFFAKGPSSSTNDGSRCAQAPVIDDSNADIDFGDAPDTYGTTMANNGARHGLSEQNEYYLGDHVDGESDASLYPLSDDNNSDVNDDDGVQFATNIAESSNAIASIEASKKGYLSAWIDLDRNGQFDGNEQVVQDIELQPGKQFVYLPIPVGIVGGESWARFRFSSTEGVQAIGGAPDGEVEDYQVELVEQEATVTTYPSQNDWTTIAFEDNWPHEGDYDMNDLVVHLRTSVHSKSTGVTMVTIKGEISALGAAYHNGFAVRLPGLDRNLVDVDNIEYSINGNTADFQPLEADRNEAILIMAYDLWDYIASGQDCKYYRTEPGCGSDIQMSFSARIPMINPVEIDLAGAFDPFLFASPGAWHGNHFVTAPGRSYEIHMKNQAPTEAFDITLFEQPGDDTSAPDSDYYFQTAKGMPWAMEIGTRWDHPVEYRDIGHVYPYFSQWTQSNGAANLDWYIRDNANIPLLFEN